MCEGCTGLELPFQGDLGWVKGRLQRLASAKLRFRKPRGRLASLDPFAETRGLSIGVAAYCSV